MPLSSLLIVFSMVVFGHYSRCLKLVWITIGSLRVEVYKIGFSFIMSFTIYTHKLIWFERKYKCFFSNSEVEETVRALFIYLYIFFLRQTSR